MGLVVKSGVPGKVKHTRWVDDSENLKRLIDKLMAHSVAFYVEPDPGDVWMVVVDWEHAHFLDRTITEL